MIVKLSSKHLNQLARIDLESSHQMSSHLNLDDYKEMLRHRFEEKHEVFFGFKEKNELKGYITIRLFFPGYKHCEIYWLSVKSKYHGKGIGTKLVKFVETHAKQRGFGKIFAYTNKAMKRTRKFYEKLGYKLINEFPGYYSYPENDTAVLYGKDLL